MRKKIKQLIAAVMTITTLAVSALPVYAEEVDQYPLKGTFPYTLITKEIVDKRLAEGWAFTGAPYAEVGTAIPFGNSAEWAQVNNFKSSVATGINSGKILINLAGLTSAPDSYSGSALTAEEEAVKNEVIKYLNSYDWKNASDYEKAAYTAEYIASRCEYTDDIQINSSYTCLVKGVSACDGFAQTYHLLTRAVGLKSVQVGTLSHTWNYVMIKGQWYEMDTSLVSSPSETSRQEYIQRFLGRIPVDTAKYLWIEKGIDLDFDSTIPNQPMY